MIVNTKLKEAHEKIGLTQVEAAIMANISERTYQRFEAGERQPNVRIALLIAKNLNSTVEELF